MAFHDDVGRPIILDPEAPFWPDLDDSSKFWYAPTFELIPATPTSDNKTSPFIFSVLVKEQVGPELSTLEGTVRFALRWGMSEITRISLDQYDLITAMPVPILNLSVMLFLPFNDGLNARREQLFAATFEILNGVVWATVRFIDDWARLCYSVLAAADMQLGPARIEVTYSFEGTRFIPGYVSELPYGFQIVSVNLLPKAPEIPIPVEPSPPLPETDEIIDFALPGRIVDPKTEQPIFEVDRVGAILKWDAGSLVTNPRRSGGFPNNRNRELGLPVIVAGNVPQLQNVSTLIGEIHRPLKLVVMNESNTIEERTITEIRQKFDHLDSISISYPCNVFGHLYQRLASDGSLIAFGCLDDLITIKTHFQQYEEITDEDLVQRKFRIFRSLQQPGRFLVLPRAYHIARSSPYESVRAYQPTIALYSNIGGPEDELTRCLFVVRLEPDVPLYLRVELIEKLKKHARNPILDFPTQIPSDVVCKWALGDEFGAKPYELLHPDAIQVTFTMNLLQGQILAELIKNFGVYGSVIFKLPDGSEMLSALEIDLTRITGPWHSGPVETIVNHDTVKLTNMIEARINITGLLLRHGSGPLDRIPLDFSLSPGQAIQLNLPAFSDEVYPIFELEPEDPAAMEEIRIYFDDIHIPISFVNAVNYVLYNLKELRVETRIKNVPGFYSLVLTERKIETLIITLPLTTYVNNRILEYWVTKVTTDNLETVTGTLTWDLEQGCIVDIDWDLIK